MLKLIRTKDNSLTLYNETLDETYHSKHGAVQESRHVFIREGLQPFLRTYKNIRLLEIGFGTGLNALLSYLEFESSGSAISYTGIEPFPLSEEIIEALNYKGALDLSDHQYQVYKGMHAGNAGAENQYHCRFTFELIRQQFLHCTFEKQFDLIYFDAFAPGKQSDMWNADTFAYCYRLLNAQGVLVTYCAKGEVKRSLRACGFRIETLAGPPGKREMIRAVKM